MLDLTLTDQSIAAAAVARRKSFGVRALHNAGCALSAALITNTLIAPAAWYLLIVALMAVDLKTGRAFLLAPLEQKPQRKILFILTSISIVVAFMGMALWTALYGGEAGRIAAMFMAAASLITVMILLVEAPLFLALSAIPSFVLLAVLPFVAHTSGGSLQMLGLMLALGVFASQLVRTTVRHASLSAGHLAAREEAERRRVEAEMRRMEAERANRAKSEFLYAVTHELRTPLNAVINYAEIISEDAAGMDGVIAEDASRIRRSAHHLLSMIDRIIDYSALDTGHVSLSVETFPAAKAVREVIDAHRAAAEAQGNHIAVEGADPMVNLDRKHFARCVDCLVANAVKFTHKGLVSVSVRDDGDQLSISVKDTGPGLSADQIGVVFELFAQADGSRTRAADGLGLGLPTARAIARAMGGDISVESAPGRGACFTLMLPLAGPAANPAALVASAA